MREVTPKLILESVDAKISTTFMRHVSKRARCSLVLDEDGNAPISLLRTRQSEQAARAAQTARDTTQKRIALYCKRPMFAVFCEEHGLDIENMGDEELLDATKQFDEAITDETVKHRLRQRTEKPRHESTRHQKSIEERLPSLLPNPAFRMLLSDELGEVPEAPDPSTASTSCTPTFRRRRRSA